MPSNQTSLAARSLAWLAGRVIRLRGWLIYPQLLLAALCVAFTINGLGFLADRNDLVGTDKKYHQVYVEFRKDFQDPGDLVAVIESENREKNREFAERLAARLRLEPEVFRDVFYKGDLTELGKKALLFVPDEDLVVLEKTLGEFLPFIDQFSQTTNLVTLFDHINSEFIASKDKTEEETEPLLNALPALGRIISKAGESLTRQGVPISPGIDALFGADEEAEGKQYITFADGRYYLVSARAKEWALNPIAVERFRALLEATKSEVPGVNAGITGEPVLEVDEMAQAQSDMIVASAASFIFVALVFIFGYHEVSRPIKATLCLVIGLAYTMGYTTLTVGHLNILTITFAPILIGLAIDLGVHLISRYEEELRHGVGGAQAIETALVHTGQGIFTGAFTTAGAFFAMGFTDFDGIVEMGIITGGGMLVCLVPMMTMLPALLLKSETVRAGAEDDQCLRSRIGRSCELRPGRIVLLGLAVTFAAAVFVPRVRFDYNLLNLQTRDLPAVNIEKELINSASKSVIYGISTAGSIDEALEKQRQFESLPVVAAVESMAPYFADERIGGLQMIQRITEIAGQVVFEETDLKPVDLPALDQQLWGLQGYLKAAMNELETVDKPELLLRVEELYLQIRDFRQQLSRVDETSAGRKLAQYQQALFEDVRTTFTALSQQYFTSVLKPSDLPPSLRDRFVGQSGRLLLQVYPKENVWEKEAQERFVAATRQVDELITGTPVQLLEYTTLLKNSYVEAAWYALATIMALVLFHFRSLIALLLTLLPVLIGCIWTAGFMGLAGIPFNPANIMTLPLVIGIGVTNGIHILSRFSELGESTLLSNSTGKAVLVSGLTTIGGFASLNLAKHQGIASLGAVMSIGVASCMIVGLAILPAILQLLAARGWRLGKSSS